MRILLIRTSALGDVVHCLPVLTALRKALPEATIGWVVEDSMAPLLDGHPDLDQLLEVRLRAWRRRLFSPGTIREVGDFLGAMRRFAPEVVIDLMGNHKAGVIAGLTMCDRRVGASRSERREPSSALWISEPVAPRGEHVSERALSLLQPLGIDTGPPDYGGDRLFPTAEAPSGLPARFFVVHPGAAWANKRYPAPLWGEVAAALGAATGLDGLVTYGPGEADLARQAAHASGGALELVETSELGSLAAVLRRAELVLGADTGPLHLAHALGSRVLCLMGPTDPASHGPFGIPRSALWHELPCSFCHKRFDEPKACLTTLPPQIVTERALELLRV